MTQLDLKTSRLELDLHPLIAGKIDLLATKYKTTPGTVVAKAISLLDEIDDGTIVAQESTIYKYRRGKTVRWIKYEGIEGGG